MIYTADGYETRARECVALANQAKDDLIQRELLKLRQTYLVIAERLRNTERGQGLDRAGRDME